MDLVKRQLKVYMVDTVHMVDMVDTKNIENTFNMLRALLPTFSLISPK